MTTNTSVCQSPTLSATRSEPAFSSREFVTDLRRDIGSNKLKLPTLPRIALEALLIVNDADSCADDVANVISKDTSMAARLIRYANSPLFHGASAISTVKAAITRIGFNKVKQAIYTVSMQDVFNTSDVRIQNRMERLWKHSVEVASRSAQLAEKFAHLNKDEALLAGLIHDIGTIPILLKVRDHKVLVENEQNLDKVIRATHMVIGRQVLSCWRFDPRLIEVAAGHDQLDRKPRGAEVDYIDIVQVANILCYEGSEHPYGQLDRTTIPVFSRPGLDDLDCVPSSAQRDRGDELTEFLVCGDN